MNDPDPHTDDLKGHRNRLRERYVASGVESLGDHEKLELLLTYAIHRKDTKSLAKMLLGRFKTIGAVMNASAGALQELDGIGPSAAALLHLVRDLTVHCLRERIERGDPLTQHRDVQEYLRLNFGHRRDEYVAVLFLDGGNRVTGSAVIAEGTVNQCHVYPRTIVEKGIRLGAAGFILCHNHPGGTMHASEEDWKITEKVWEIGTLLDMPLMDHLIVAQDRVISLREYARWPVVRKG